MSVEYKDLVKFQKQLENTIKGMDKEMEKATKKVATRLLDTVKAVTPVSTPKTINGIKYIPYTAGGMRRGGSLLKAWDKDNKKLIVHKTGDYYYTAIHNNNYYASYVERGHSQKVGKLFPTYKNGKLVMVRHKQAFVPGQFFLKKSEDKIKNKASKIVDKHIIRYLEENLDV